MGNCHIPRDKLIQNLKDAGLDEGTIEKYFMAIDADNKKKAMDYIEKYREDLLREFHQCSNYIDCLDYFVMQSGKE